MRIVILSVLLLLLAAASLRAHPVPKENHDRTLLVRLTPEAILVDYRLEVDESRAVRDLPVGELAGVTSRRDVHAAFTRYHAKLLAGNLLAKLDGQELAFTCVESRHELLDHVRCDFRFRATWRLSPEGRHRFTFRECNYELDGFSKLHVTLVGSPMLTLTDVTAPDDALLARPADQRRPGDGERLRQLSATVLAQPSFLPGVARPALPPDLDDPKPPARSRKRPAGLSKSSSSAPVAIARTPPDTEELGKDGHRSGLLQLLLDTRQGLSVLLLLAAGFGAAHALTPGHGKTLVAAYLIGQRGTVWHALVLGLATTLTHTGSVLVLALLLWWFDIGTRTAAVVLHLVGGLLITGLGVWLLLQRLTGHADHVHIGGGHHHGEPAPDPGQGATWWATVVLGVGGGIVPCWDAILLLLFAISTQRLYLGVPLLLAFSAGLAGVLVLLGIIVVHAGEHAETHLGGRERFQRLFQALPAVSAVAIIVLGLMLAFGTGAEVP